MRTLLWQMKISLRCFRAVPYNCLSGEIIDHSSHRLVIDSVKFLPTFLRSRYNSGIPWIRYHSPLASLLFLGVGGQAAKGIAKVAAIRGTPELVLALHNEISDLQVVGLAIQDIFDNQRASGVPFPGPRIGEINIDASITSTLKQANDMVTNLEAFCTCLKASASSSTGTITFDRTLWIREQRKIKRMKDDLKSVRLKLTTALGALNASALFRLETYLRVEFQEQRRHIQKAETSQNHRSDKNATSIQNLRHKIDELHILQRQFQATQDQRLLQYTTGFGEPMTRLLMAQDRFELKLNAIDAERIARRVAP